MPPAFRDTKTYDLLAVSPLIVFYVFAAAGILIQTAPQVAALGRHFEWAVALDALSQILGMSFLLFQVVLFIIRRPPSARAEGLAPNAAAIVGANIAALFLLLPRAHNPVLSLASAALLSVGTLGAIVTAWWLRGAFAILPQARTLVTTGPYSLVRHPLYLSEIVATIGLSLQFAQPLATLTLLFVVGLQFFRMHYEEAVLLKAFPEYAAYRAGKARLIPGLY